MQDLQTKLTAIMQSINDFKQVEEQAIYGAEMSLKTREYNHLLKCTEKLISAQVNLIVLSSEAKEVLILIDEEKKEVIL